MKKKISTFLVFSIIFFLGFFVFVKTMQASSDKKLEILKQEKINKVNDGLKKLFIKTNKQSKIEQKEFYNKLIIKLEKFVKKYKEKLNKNLETKFKNIISGGYKNKLKEINFYILDDILFKLKQKNNSIILSKINFKKSQTLILRFTNNSANNNKIIYDNKKNIENNLSVFIFRNGANLSRINIQKITLELKKINSKILIFIDQEGGLINRYTDFENKNDIDKFFLSSKNKYLFLEERLNKISTREIKIIRNIFPKNNGFFPSLETIGITYDKFKDKNNAKVFLEIIAFIRLQSLKEVGINTYGLVLDLNRGNPAISGNSRSFSKHLWKYKLLSNAFLKAGKNTEIILYAKHFPGHGAGKIDSHKNILNLKSEENYLKENLELFDYFFKNSGELETGLMVGHIYFGENLKNKFNSIIDNSKFLLTDDLAMLGYKKAKGKKLKNLLFSTDMIINKENLIIVDTINIGAIK